MCIIEALTDMLIFIIIILDQGSFNWRMVFPITLPAKDPTITFQIWDKVNSYRVINYKKKDILTPNDFIAEATLRFEEEAKDAFTNDLSVKI